MEMHRTKNQQLEHLVSAYKKSLEEAASNVAAVGGMQSQHSFDHRLKDSSESALHTLNSRLREELESQKNALNRERQRYLEREEEYIRLKGEYRRVKRRLEKREAMVAECYFIRFIFLC